MKTLTIVLFVVALTAAQPVSDETKEELKGIHNECSETTGIKKEDIMKALEGESSDDPKIKEHMFCFQEKLGVITDDGKIKKDVLKENLKKFVDDDDKVDEIVEKCSEEKDTPVDTAYALAMCIHNEKVAE